MPAMTDSDAIDVTWLRKTFDEDSVLAELYTMYEGDTAKRLSELHTAFAANDAARCSRVAHAMKGSSGNVGAGRMRELAAQLEKHDVAADFAGAETLVRSLDGEFLRVQAFIQQFLAACPVAG